MIDVLKAMGTSGAILLPIVVLIVLISIATVKRGEAAMGGHEHVLTPNGNAAALHAVGTVASPAPAVGKKPAVAEPVEEISVIQVLVFGIVMFTAVMVLLLIVSIIQHR